MPAAAARVAPSGGTQRGKLAIARHPFALEVLLDDIVKPVERADTATIVLFAFVVGDIGRNALAIFHGFVVEALHNFIRRGWRMFDTT